MLIIALNGSPREGGNTQMLLDEALEGARQCGAETLRIDLNRLTIKGCQACDGCPGSGVCRYEDDMVKIYALLERADALIVGTPVYFSGPTAQLKLAMDRCQCIWSHGPGRKGRRSAMISVSGDESANFRNVISEVRSFVNSIGFEIFEEMTVPGIDNRGAVASRPDLLEKARDVGARLTRP